MKTSKKLILYLFSGVGFTSLVIFGIVNVITGDTLSGFIELGAGLLAILNLVLLYATKNEELAGSIILFIMLALLVFLSIDGGIGGTGFFWFFVFPPLAFYLKELKKAITWSALLIGSIFTIYSLGYIFYPPVVLTQLFASFLALSFMVYFYALTNKRSTAQITEQAESLSTLNNELSKKLSAQEKLDGIISEKNKELEDTKRAVLNVLEDLQEEKSRDEAILASIGDALFVTDADGALTMVNDVFESLLGLSEKEIIGKRMVDVVVMLDTEGQTVLPQDRPISIALASTTDVSPKETFYFKRSNDETFPISISLAPILISGQAIGAVGIFRDISEEHAVDRAKTEFVSLASHQLRTPLSAIKWYVELLLSGDFGVLDKTQREYVLEIQRGSERMIELVSSLLDVSRLELGTFSEDPTKINVASVVEDIIKEHAPVIKEKEIAFTKELSNDLPYLVADKKLTRIVFENLISNAVKYTPKKGTVSVSLALEEKSGVKEFSYVVQDSGIGIPTDQQDKVFQKLFRADNAREGDTDGTGLGLYLVKLIIEKMGGTIRFESSEGKGTTFFVRLPLRSSMSETNI